MSTQIDALPDAPAATDPVDTFDSKAFSFNAALAAFRTQANAMAAEMQINADVAAAIILAMALPQFAGTSSSSVTIGTGAKVFVTQTGKGWLPGQIVVVTNGANYVKGSVTSYSGADLSINVTSVNGTGTFGVWDIGLSYDGLSLAKSGPNSDITSLLVLTAISGANALLINSATTSKPPVRQTVLSGPVDTNGAASFGGSIGSTTVTASGTLIATAAKGYALGGGVDYTGSITNPSWTGLATNGVMYLYLDIAANGTCTTGSTTLAPTYRWGGADVTTSGQFTFNIQEMSGKVGNGATAAQVYRVFVGQVTVAGGVVSGTIVWYALQGRYDSGYTNTIPISATTSRNTNLGVVPMVAQFLAKCLTAEGGYAVNDTTTNFLISNGSYIVPAQIICTENTAAVPIGINARVTNKSTQADFAVTPANWAYRIVATRGW